MIACVTVLDTFSSSDHNLLQWEIKLLPVASVFNCTRLDYSRADFDAIRQALSGMDWLSTLRGDVNEQWDIFLGILKGLERQFVPQRKLNKRRQKVPWITYYSLHANQPRYKPRWDRADLSRYQSSCSRDLSCIAVPVEALLCKTANCCDHFQLLNSYYCHIVDCMRAAGDACVPQVRVGIEKHWWSPE